MNDLYGDRGNSVLPDIDTVDTLCFKLAKNTYISKLEQKELVNKIIELNVGSVEIKTVDSFGRYIVIVPYK